MNISKLLIYMFLVRVLIPLQGVSKYEVKEYELLGEMISLTLKDGNHILVPAMWTIIEEIKEK